MPRVFDNIDLHLLPTLRKGLDSAQRADFCVGYLNLRGWKALAGHLEHWPGGEGHQCRLLVGMPVSPREDLREIQTNLMTRDTTYRRMDRRQALDRKQELARSFREQLTVGAPTNADEAGLRQFARQIRECKVRVKVFLAHPLHAKLYLLATPDSHLNPLFGYLGSSNLTWAGLDKQGELNVDVLDSDACNKLQDWFNARWNDPYCVDISDELIEILEESWAREKLIPPYHIYLKIAYHLSREAREGIASFEIPAEFRDKLFPFQAAAVRIAANHLNKRGGVMIGDVVGLGKTMMATALARIFEEDFGVSTLIICPPNLQEMWQAYADEYGLRARIVSLGLAERDLQEVPARFRLVLIDESQNLRNPEGQRYRAIQKYVNESDSRCILLSATPYNKSFGDLSAQLQLFSSPEADLGIRPERLISEIGETQFSSRFQVQPRTLAAFEKSHYPDDWRDLMRLFLVRRTRSFIVENYAETDSSNGRKYLLFEDGQRSYFPDRMPKTVKFKLDDENPEDQYARLYSAQVVDTINSLNLPRYGLGNYILPETQATRTGNQKDIIDGLNRAGKRLMGFCRTNLFKRLESGGPAFLQSVERHILRNHVYMHAIDSGQPIPIGSQDVLLYDPQSEDEDPETAQRSLLETVSSASDESQAGIANSLRSRGEFLQQAEHTYNFYRTQRRTRFRWLESQFTIPELRVHLEWDCQRLMSILELAGHWNSNRDAKLHALLELIQRKHPHEKVLIFSQFADTVNYLYAMLSARGMQQLDAVTGDTKDPTDAAQRFSPISNKRPNVAGTERETRVLVSTDVLSEGQNLQDAHIIVNFDLPWAIIRLIQRAGRVDRIGQQADEILCYSFLPAEGVERIINLRGRVRQRLQENAEVVGADEAFFEDEQDDRPLIDLYNEKSGLLDDDVDYADVDLASQALEIWDHAVERDPSLAKKIPALPDVIYSTKPFQPKDGEPPGALVYVKTAMGNDALAWVDLDGNLVSESQLRILHAAECAPDTPAQSRHDQHHEIVKKAVAAIAKDHSTVGGQLGRPSSARHRTYDRLHRYVNDQYNSIFITDTLKAAVQELYTYPLLQSTSRTLNRQLRSGIEESALADLVVELYQDGRLCHITEGDDHLRDDPRILCSLGLRQMEG